jgi:hypothetical protein
MESPQINSITEIENKEDSQERLQSVSGKPTKYILFATEFMAVLNSLKNLLTNKFTLQEVLTAGSTATFTNTTTEDVVIIEEIKNTEFEFMKQTVFTSADNNKQANSSMTVDGITQQTNKITGDLQFENQIVLNHLDTTAGAFNVLKATAVTDTATNEAGGFTVEHPTPHLNKNVIIRFPDKTTSGTYELATKDEIISSANFLKSQTSDITTTSNTQIETALFFPIGAGELWHFEVFLKGGCGSSGGITTRVNTPTGASGYVFLSTTTIDINTVSGAFGQGNSNGSYRFGGFVKAGTTAGNVVISFASTNAGQTSYLRANSFIVATKIN